MADDNLIQDIGKFATIKKSKRNTHTVPLPEQLWDVVHENILCGSKTAKCGITYVLLLVKRTNRYKCAHPFHSLNGDTIPELKKVFENWTPPLYTLSQTSIEK